MFSVNTNWESASISRVRGCNSFGNVDTARILLGTVGESYRCVLVRNAKLAVATLLLIATFCTVSFSLAQFEQIARAGSLISQASVFQASEAGNGTVRSRPQDSDAIFQVFFSAKCGGTGVGYTTLGGGEGKRSILGKLPRGAFCQLLHNGDGAIIDVVVYHFAIIDLCGSAVGHFYRVDCIAYLVMIRGRDFFYIVGADRDVAKETLPQHRKSQLQKLW